MDVKKAKVICFVMLGIFVALMLVMGITSNPIFGYSAIAVVAIYFILHHNAVLAVVRKLTDYLQFVGLNNMYFLRGARLESTLLLFTCLKAFIKNEYLRINYTHQYFSWTET